MEALAARIATFCLQKHYIESDQIAWLQYGLTSRLIGVVTFMLLLPIGAFFGGWESTFLFLLIFRFLRTRTGGFHAKTPSACFFCSAFTMIVSLEFAKRLCPIWDMVCLITGTFLIIKLAPANNAALHLNIEEFTAIQRRIVLRLSTVMLFVLLLWIFNEPLAYQGISAILAVAGTLLASKLGFGMQ